jgi:hypothetical protein
MRLKSPLVRRLERLEAIARPPSRHFVMFEFDLDDRGFAERERAFRAENGVRENDAVHLVRLNFNDAGQHA